MISRLNDESGSLPAIDAATKCLVRIAGAIAGANEAATRAVMEAAVGNVENSRVEEVILQSYLFAGFPRTLNAARIWRSVSTEGAPLEDTAAEVRNSSDWVVRGEKTCKVVYGESYEMLRTNIRALHPALDSWMITDGYGKVLSRPELDLKTRELCIVAACATTGQQRQLHSHLHGALNAGATADEVRDSLEALRDLTSAEDLDRFNSLLDRVTARRHPPSKESVDVR